MPQTSSSLQPIYIFHQLQSSVSAASCFFNCQLNALRWVHINFQIVFRRCLGVSNRYVAVPWWVAPDHTECKNDSRSSHIHHRQKGILIIDVFNLLITACYQACLVALNHSICISLQLEHKTRQQWFHSVGLSTTIKVLLSHSLCNLLSIAVFQCSAAGVFVEAA